MQEKKIFQTLEDLGNPEYVEEHGPFFCDEDNAWLGDGYYFWDTFIQNAHWWGIVRYKDPSQYIICQAFCDFDLICQAFCDFDWSLCFDLVGNTEHMEDFRHSKDFLVEEGFVNERTTVCRMIRYIREQTTFPYQAIRVYGINSISHKREEYERYRNRINFEAGKSQYLDYTPAIQMCIFEKNGLNLRDLFIVYPDKYYNEDFVV